jgi:hypothetical protein
VAEANNQTGLASGSLLTQARQKIALGVCGTAMPTPPQVALWSSCGSFPIVDDWPVAMMLTWHCWSLEDSLLVGVCRVGHSPKIEVLVFVVTPQ